MPPDPLPIACIPFTLIPAGEGYQGAPVPCSLFPVPLGGWRMEDGGWRRRDPRGLGSGVGVLEKGVVRTGRGWSIPRRILTNRAGITVPIGGRAQLNF